jgi:hypothetical protein
MEEQHADDSESGDHEVVDIGQQIGLVAGEALNDKIHLIRARKVADAGGPHEQPTTISA